MNHDRDVTFTPGPSRRAFLEQFVLTTALGATGRAAPASGLPDEQGGAPDPAPWYRRALRWGQTNITEIDPTSYDIAWWRRY
jgi:hypothetical protein